MTRWSPFWDWNMTPVLHSSTPNRTSNDAYLPPMDIEEEEGQYVVTLSVPGYSQDHLKISLEEDVLQIQGALNSENESDETVGGRKYHLRERHVNQFPVPCGFRQALTRTRSEPSMTKGSLL